MDIQLQDLIDKIKKDGVAKAESDASEIIRKAEDKAKSIISDAEKKADDMIRSSKNEIARLEKASEDAIAQASRNMLLTFRNSLVEELDRLIKDETEKAYSKTMLKTLIPETVKAWSKNAEAGKLSVLLSEKDCKDLEDEFKDALKTEIAKGLEIKPDKSITSGFRIGVDNGNAYYDYSADSVSDLFAAYLNPRVAAIMKNAAKE